MVLVAPRDLSVLGEEGTLLPSCCFPDSGSRGHSFRADCLLSPTFTTDRINQDFVDKPNG
jgi:hypothetical protein